MDLSGKQLYIFECKHNKKDRFVGYYTFEGNPDYVTVAMDIDPECSKDNKWKIGQVVDIEEDDTYFEKMPTTEEDVFVDLI